MAKIMKRSKALNKQKSYRSYLSTMKRKRSEALFTWLKQAYCYSVGIPYHD